MKYIVIIAVFLAVVSCYLNFKVDALEKDNKRLEAEKNSLISNIEDYKKNEVAANNTIKELRKKISVDKTALDWYREPLPKNIYDVIKGD